jgi:tetratricopeptide (TPR) repeat protein
MPAIGKDSNRRTVPRWRSFRNTARLGGLTSSAVSTANKGHLDLTNLRKSRRDWEANHTVAFAADFLGAAFVRGEAETARDAATFLLERGVAPVRMSSQLARVVLGKPLEATADLSRPGHHQAIHRIRHLLQNDLRNGVAWIDLARSYVALGQARYGGRPIEIALSLAPDNRFILRSAARYFLHVGDIDRAHAILRQTARLNLDPWLLAAEIAISSISGRTSRFVKLAREFVERRSVSPEHTSELASELGTLEFEAGAKKRTRALIRHALISPTDNAVAQAAWVARQSGDVTIQPSPTLLMTPQAFEARAWANLRDKQWYASVDDARQWLSDEPFSSRPAVFGSWVACVALCNFHDGEMFAREGLLIDPDDEVLLNNLTYCLASTGRVAEASTHFARIDPAHLRALTRATYLATKGLLEFRSGRVSDGRTLYEDAIQDAVGRGVRREALVASLHYAREQARHDPGRAAALQEAAMRDLRTLPEWDQQFYGRLCDDAFGKATLSGDTVPG